MKNNSSNEKQFNLLQKQPQLSEAQFEKIANFIQTNVGIKMPEQKKIMVQSRLLSRLKALKMSNFDDYISYAFQNSAKGDEEISLMINVITTNLTNFFRESQHFDYVSEKALPELIKAGHNKIEVWSAGCSTGEEPYTITMVMEEFLRKNPGKISNYSVTATDISSTVLEKAIKAVYPMESTDNLSYEIKKRYFLRSKDKSNPLVRIKPALREKVSFARLNFMDKSYSIPKEKHIIFCRNVLIYFDKPTQEAVIRKLVSHLVPGGYLFLGHSETIFGMDLPLETVGPTSFRKL